MKAFTVVIPYRNRASLLPRALASVKAQTFRPIELILVDNNSTDGSAAVCADFAAGAAAEDFGVVLTAESRAGAAAARNKGLAMAGGEWVCFFDSDDEMSETFLTDAHAELVREKTDAVAAATRMHFADGHERVRDTFRTTAVTDQIITGMLATQGMAFRTAYLRDIGGWPEVPVWNDWLLGVKLLLHRPHMTWLNGAYHKIYQHADSLTGCNFSSRADALQLALREARRLLQAAPGPLRREQAALAARWAILAGQLWHEGSHGEGRCFMAEAMAGHGNLMRMAGWLLFLYTRLGGRGAWRAARWWFKA